MCYIDKKNKSYNLLSVKDTYRKIYINSHSKTRTTKPQQSPW